MKWPCDVCSVVPVFAAIVAINKFVYIQISLERHISQNSCSWLPIVLPCAEQRVNKSLPYTRRFAWVTELRLGHGSSQEISPIQLAVAQWWTQQLAAGHVACGMNSS